MRWLELVRAGTKPIDEYDSARKKKGLSFKTFLEDAKIDVDGLFSAVDKEIQRDKIDNLDNFLATSIANFLYYVGVSSNGNGPSLGSFFYKVFDRSFFVFKLIGLKDIPMCQRSDGETLCYDLSDFRKNYKNPPKNGYKLVRNDWLTLKTMWYESILPHYCPKKILNRII